MRIIAGALKGRRFRSPRWAGLRPTSDRLRETLFNVLGDRVRGAAVLDACAGTGALGFEALSRGAQTAAFVEQDRRAAALIADHAARFGVAERCRIVRGVLPDVVDDGRLTGAFDVILVDPPYDDPAIGAILSALARRLAGGGVLVLERARRSVRPAAADLTSVREIASGDSMLTIHAAVKGGSRD